MKISNRGGIRLTLSTAVLFVQLTCARPERLSVTVRTEPEARALGRSLRPLTGLSERKETTAYGGYRLILYRIYGSRAREGRHQGVTLYALGR